jgi:hypothetical protein
MRFPPRLLDDTRELVPTQAGQLAHQDDEYEHCGTANIVLGFEPLRGQR